MNLDRQGRLPRGVRGATDFLRGPADAGNGSHTGGGSLTVTMLFALAGL